MPLRGDCDIFSIMSDNPDHLRLFRTFLLVFESGTRVLQLFTRHFYRKKNCNTFGDFLTQNYHPIFLLRNTTGCCPCGKRGVGCRTPLIRTRQWDSLFVNDLTVRCQVRPIDGISENDLDITLAALLLKKLAFSDSDITEDEINAIDTLSSIRNKIAHNDIDFNSMSPSGYRSLVSSIKDALHMLALSVDEGFASDIAIEIAQFERKGFSIEERQRLENTVLTLQRENAELRETVTEQINKALIDFKIGIERALSTEGAEIPESVVHDIEVEIQDSLVVSLRAYNALTVEGNWSAAVGNLVQYQQVVQYFQEKCKLVKIRSGSILLTLEFVSLDDLKSFRHKYESGETRMQLLKFLFPQELLRKYKWSSVDLAIYMDDKKYQKVKTYLGGECNNCGGKHPGEVCSYASAQVPVTDTRSPQAPVAGSKRDTEEPTVDTAARSVRDLVHPVFYEGDRRVIVIGKAGIGKSALCNSILGREVFISKSSLEAVTEDSSFASAHREGRRIYVYDTPGALSEEMEPKTVAESISRCMIASAPGFHCILLTFEASRFRREEKDLINFLENLLGPNFYQFAIAVFTKIDNLDKDQTFQDFLDAPKVKKNATLDNLLKKCKGKIIGVNNKLKGKENDKQVAEIMKFIEKVFNDNHQKYYTNELFTKAEKLLKEEIAKEKKKSGDSDVNVDQRVRKMAFEGKTESSMRDVIADFLNKVFGKDICTVL